LVLIISFIDMTHNRKVSKRQNNSPTGKLEKYNLTVEAPFVLSFQWFHLSKYQNHQAPQLEEH